MRVTIASLTALYVQIKNYMPHSVVIIMADKNSDHQYIMY